MFETMGKTAISKRIEEKREMFRIVGMTVIPDMREKKGAKERQRQGQRLSLSLEKGLRPPSQSRER
ncbi:hypothetical protein AMTR_s00125p00088600 [Amborella trichopoda]|uniref:Uncharacterized protein n=1 Tax=Amborella trichopoda TaxID=13333 RepID=W1NRX3_AMBTC|nr:hypothetical protein AMTR_s00125p00088600 [Amborella trichopoda]